MRYVSVIKISAGAYDVGDDSIPHAGPRHRRRIDTDYWIDVAPISRAHFEVFVAKGGYSAPEFWMTGEGVPFATPGITSVDSRCLEIIASNTSWRNAIMDSHGDPETLPVTGLTWFEACAICRFYGGRLPFEVEWEIAMASGLAQQHRTDLGKDACEDHYSVQHVNGLQEWTADAYSPHYWRADYLRRGVAWAPNAATATVRGASSHDVYQHVCSRIGHEPGAKSEVRSFRRVWDFEPSANRIEAHWRVRVES